MLHIKSKSRNAGHKIMIYILISSCTCKQILFIAKWVSDISSIPFSVLFV